MQVLQAICRFARSDRYVLHAGFVPDSRFMTNSPVVVSDLSSPTDCTDLVASSGCSILRFACRLEIISVGVC